MRLSKRSKVLIGGLACGIMATIAIYIYAMQPPAKIESKKVDFTGSSDSFLTKVQKDFAIWQDKVVLLTGTITTADENGIVLSNQIYCQFREDVNKTHIQPNQKVQLKGRVIGYDDLLEELKLDQCILQQ